MTTQQALSAVHMGSAVECAKDEWPALRCALQDAASGYIDAGDHVRAQIALNEVRRLDALHGVPSLFGGR